ncbi:MAG: hypothetical protein Q7V19_18695 [Bacteroidales bacterium]|nr:hypothetical protein [Bacteroidales bacterium]MDP2237807.1 hypothetical protein [Bacteroidales bacterium]
MYIPLLKSHSGLRWILLILFVSALVMLFRAAYQGKFSKKLVLTAKMTLILTHIQLILGLVLYFISPKVMFAASSMKVTVSRFYLVEHISLMLIAVILLTIGFSKAKNLLNTQAGAKKMFTYYLISFILIMISIPWPFRSFGAGWF